MVEKNDPDEVKNPADRSAESNPENAKDKMEDIAVFDRAKNTINRPDDINDGQAEQDFDNAGKPIHRFDETIHDFHLLSWGKYTTISAK